MAFWQSRDFLFCGVCGTLLNFDSVHSASCPLCGFKRDAKDIEGKEIRYSLTAEDIRRDLKINAAALEEKLKEHMTLRRAKGIKSCPKCVDVKLEYYVKQLRSSDEGQTEFYECPKCGHKESNNT